MQWVGLCFRQKHGVKIFSSNDILQFQFCYLPTHSSVIVQSVNVQSAIVQSVNIQSSIVQSCNVHPLRCRPSLSSPGMSSPAISAFP